jgi:uncharacterized phage-associated protein
MKLQNLIYEALSVSMSMFGLSLITGPILYFVWNYVIVRVFNAPYLNIFDSIIIIFALNLLEFFKLQKRDIVLINKNEIEE